MPTVEEIIRDRIVIRHQGDARQLEVIFSSAKKILVEAPAGYGKTNTMVSKIAYLIATRQIPNPKRMLALTFSVNAAYKVKKDVSLQIPDLIAGLGIAASVQDKIFVSNYHGFCRSVLKKYGGLLHFSLLTIDTLQSVDDYNLKPLMEQVKSLSYDEAFFLSEYSNALKENREEFLSENLQKYCSIIVQELLPNGFIPYNGILTLTLKIFSDYPVIREFYQRYFTTILVDEYQDTNILSYWLICNLIATNTKMIFLGDSLQRIYGFIGAVPNLLSRTEAEFGLTKITLNKNYRFATNAQMLQLDSNIRKIAERPTSPNIIANAIVEFRVVKSQKDEADEVRRKALEIIHQHEGSKVAILVKQRGENVNCIIGSFEHNRTPYFYGLFTDEDIQYIRFHRSCLFEFIEILKGSMRITKKVAQLHIQTVKQKSDESAPTIQALLQLLDIFWEKFFVDFSSFSNDDKISLIKDTFEHNGLKQYLEFVQTRIIISTVHAAKGLEWDHVILPDMEQDSFPNYMGLCGPCRCKPDCQLIVTAENETKFLEELSVFYVAVTRAKKQVYFTASEFALDKWGNDRAKKLSCFLSLPGIVY